MESPTCLQKLKSPLREELKKRRNSISLSRRREAGSALSNFFSKALAPFPLVLSFFSFSHEIEMEMVNAALCKQGKLLLPKIEDETLQACFVSNFSDLVSHPWGFQEPRSSPQPLEMVSLVLVPGLGFDHTHHRLGYGKGHYDRLLAQLSPSIPTWGIGFKEQLVEKLPTENHDIPLSKLLLF